MNKIASHDSELTDKEKVAILEDRLTSLGYDIPYNDNKDKVDDRKRFWSNEENKERDLSGYIYFIQEKQTNTIKIGKAKDLDRRYKVFEVKLPFEINLLDSVNVSNRHKAEKILHDHFSNYRKNGEWFDLDSSDVIQLNKNKYKPINQLVIENGKH